jgi:hypothetical protein
MSFTQQFGGQVAGGGVVSSTPAVTIAPGSFLFVWAKVNTWSPGVATLTDTLGGQNWINILNNFRTNHNSADGVSVWYALNAKGGTGAVTFTSPGSSFPTVFGLNYSDRIAGLDNNSPIAIGHSAALNSGNVTLSSPNDLLIEYTNVNQGVPATTTMTDGAVFRTGSNGPFASLWDRTAGAPGTYAATATGGGIYDWQCALFAFRLGGGRRMLTGFGR